LTKKEQDDKYSTVRIPKEFAKEMDKLIGTRGFTSRAEITKEAVRKLLNEYKREHLKILNHDDKGVKIWDEDLRQHAEIQIAPKGIYCTLCDASKCEHIRFALRERDIREYVQKRIKEGWALEFPDE